MPGPAGGMGPDALQPLYRAVDVLCRPQIVFLGTVLVFFAGLKLRKYLVKPLVAAALGVSSLALLGLGLLNDNFRALAVKPDNVAIWLLLFLTVFFLWVALHQAVRNDERIREGLVPSEQDAAAEEFHAWPHLLYLEAIVAAFVLAVLFLWSILLEAPLEQFANTSQTPNPSKAPWYFLGLQEMLVYFDAWLAGVVFPGLIIIGLIAIPYCDPNPDGVGHYTFEKRKFAITTFLFGFLVLWISLIFVGTFLRGPNWNFYGLFEYWDRHKVEPLNNVNLSEYIHQDLFGRAAPAAWWTREWPGLIILLGYFTVLPAAGAAVFKRTYRQLGFARYSILVVLGLSMLSLPVKMLLRWTFNLKYIVSIPEHFFNI